MELSVDWILKSTDQDTQFPKIKKKKFKIRPGCASLFPRYHVTRGPAELCLQWSNYWRGWSLSSMRGEEIDQHCCSLSSSRVKGGEGKGDRNGIIIIQHTWWRGYAEEMTCAQLFLWECLGIFLEIVVVFFGGIWQYWHQRAAASLEG